MSRFRASLLVALLGLTSPVWASGPHPTPTPTPTPLPPQPPLETVFSTNMSNDRLLRLTFPAGAGSGSATVVNTPLDALIRKDLEGIAVRNDPPGVSVIACDSWGNRVMFYPNAQGPAQVAGQTITSVKAPDGVSLDTGNNLFLVSSPFEWWLPRQVWTVPLGGAAPGGYGTKQLIDAAVPANILEDTEVAAFASGAIALGDLLVVSQSPAQLLQYRFGADPDGAASAWVHLSSGWNRRIFTTQFPFGARPTGIAIAPNLDILVSTWAGTVYRFNSSGVRNPVNFTSGCGGGRLKMAVGMQSGNSYAFVANRSQGGKILRFLIKADGTGQAAGNVDDKVNQPNGVGMASVVPTPAGDNVHVQLAPQDLVTLDFDHVDTAGVTTNGIVEFPDNRGCEGNSGSQSLRDFFAATDPLHTALPDIQVPCYIQGFKKCLAAHCDDSEHLPTGPSTLLLAIIDTTAKFKRTSRFAAEEETRGLDAHALYGCADSTYASGFQSRTFYAPETAAPKSEADIVERYGEGGQRVFTDISDGCGSNKGSGWSFSLYLTGRDTRDPIDIVDYKLQYLRTALTSFAAFIDADLFATLDSSLAAAESAFASLRGSLSQPDRDAVQAALEAFRDAADSPANAAKFHNDLPSPPRNLGGELTARAKSALFILPKIVVTVPPPPTCPCAASFTAIKNYAAANHLPLALCNAPFSVEWSADHGTRFNAEGSMYITPFCSATQCNALIDSHSPLSAGELTACQALVTSIQAGLVCSY